MTTNPSNGFKGALSADAAGVPGYVSTQTSDVPRPDMIDYLKVRVYLYKFAPEMIYADKRQGGGQTQNSLASQRKDEAKKIKDELINIKASLEAIPLFPPPNVPSGRYTQAVSNLRLLLNKRAISSNQTLYLGNPTAETKGNATSNFTGIVGIPFEGSYAASSTVGQVGLPAGAGSIVKLPKNPTGTINSLYYSCRDILIPRLERLAAGNTSESFQEAENVRIATIDFLNTAIMEAENLSGDDSLLNNLAKNNQTYLSSLKQFKISKFIYDLKPKDLFRFDITDYVSSYQTSQTLGLAGVVGTLTGAVSFQNAIIPLSKLSTEGVDAIRRPIFFPDEKGNYAGWIGDEVLGGRSSLQLGSSLAGYTSAFGSGSASSLSLADATDPITKEKISTENEDTLVYRIAQQQTCEDNGAVVDFDNDVGRIEVAMRLRGINNPRKKELIIQFFKTGKASEELLNYISSSKQGKLSDITPGNVGSQLDQLINVLTDKKEDGVIVGDLIQKRDFLSTFVYCHSVSPVFMEAQAKASDPNYFDKESLFLYAPLKLFTGSKTDDRHFEMYSPEMNGFIQDVAYEQAPGSMNNVEVRLIGAMGLFGATKRIFNATIYQGSIFDAAEIMDSRLFTLYANLFSELNPLEILDILLDSTYLIRSGVPKDVAGTTVTDAEKKTITDAVEKGLLDSTLPPAKLAEKKKQLIEKKLADQLAKNRKNSALKTNRNPGSKTEARLAFFDILSLRAFNQFNPSELGADAKGPKHLFNMSSFLFANVMRMRRFNVRLPSPENLSPTVKQSFDSAAGTVVNFPREGNSSGGSILEITRSLDKTDTKSHTKAFKSYFLFLNEGFANFTPGLKTAFEIMNDVSGSSYLELFESSSGRFIFRTPQYNNNVPIYTSHITSTLNANRVSDVSAAAGTTTTGATSTTVSKISPNMITSDDIAPVASMYKHTAQGMRTKQQLAYGFDLVGGPLIEQLQYFYSNGKLVSQYGLELGKTEINPNVRAISKERLEVISTGAGFSTSVDSWLKGTFGYCRFFLEYANMQLYTGTVRAVGTPRVEVGRTYFDIPNQKFGYISSVSKSLSVGQSYVVTFELIAVRDAVFGEEAGKGEKEPRPKFRSLPYLEDFVPHFVGDTTPAENKGTKVDWGKPDPAPFEVVISDRTATSRIDFSGTTFK